MKRWVVNCKSKNMHVISLKRAFLGAESEKRASEEYCRKSPGPWDPLPAGESKKDAWGRPRVDSFSATFR